MGLEIPKDSSNINAPQSTSKNQREKQNNDISIWCKDDGDGTFTIKDIIDENLKKDSKFINKIKDLFGTPFNDTCKNFLVMQKELYDLKFGKPKATETNSAKEREAIYNSQKQGKEIANKLKLVLDGSDTNVNEAKKELEKITPENVAYIVQNFKDLAKEIDNVFAWGDGFDKKDVYKHVLSKLITRFNSFNTKEILKEIKNEAWVYTPEYQKVLSIIENKGFSEDNSLDEMNNAIIFLSSIIINEEKKKL